MLQEYSKGLKGLTSCFDLVKCRQRPELKGRKMKTMRGKKKEF